MPINIIHYSYPIRNRFDYTNDYSLLVTKGEKSLSYMNPIYGDILIPTCSLNLFRKRLDSAIRYQVAIQYVLKYGRMTRDEINDHIYENKRRLNRFIGPYTRLKMLQIMI